MENKTIWFMWLQGMDNMPLVVERCYNSWKKNNPTWNLVFISAENISNYFSLDETIGKNQKHITNQALSDIIRINLLNQYGGVWVDATCFCSKPLDNWLFNYLKSGFFAFNKPGPDRMISSWFLVAAEKKQTIIEIYAKAVNDYWSNSELKPFPLNGKLPNWLTMVKFDLKLTSNPILWHSFLVKKIIKLYPYFWFHYLFEKLYDSNTVFKTTWDKTPKFTADIPHEVQFSGLFTEPSPEIKAFILDKKAPLHKLTWKYDDQMNNKNSTLNFLFENG